MLLVLKVFLVQWAERVAVALRDHQDLSDSLVRLDVPDLLELSVILVNKVHLDKMVWLDQMVLEVNQVCLVKLVLLVILVLMGKREMLV